MKLNIDDAFIEWLKGKFPEPGKDATPKAIESHVNEVLDNYRQSWVELEDEAERTLD